MINTNRSVNAGKENDTMNQAERRLFLIQSLLDEQPRYRDMTVPNDADGQKDLLRALMNVRLPAEVSEEYLAVERDYLQQEIAEAGVVSVDALDPIKGNLYLWQGDITRLACDAIVNAANSQMLGCFRPLHNCIDNCIHSRAGLSLRNACHALMQRQGHEEPTGSAKLTSAYNLPSRYVIHTVGPIVEGRLTRQHCELLASCYRSCLTLAEENRCESIAFCCISTGVFGFPQREAAEIAVRTVEAWKAERGNPIKVIFNVFKDEDWTIYRHILAR